QLVIVYRGEAHITIDGKGFHLPAQHVSLQRPGQREFFQFSRSTQTHHSWCSFDCTFASQDEQGLVEALPFSLPLSRRLEELVRLGLSVGPGELPYAQPLLTKLGECALLEFLTLAHARKRALPLPEALRKARQFIDLHYAEPLALADLGRAANVSVPHLIRLFRRHLGVTPSRYLWRLRLRRGVSLLRDTGLPIADIAYRSGFQTPAHFSRLVKEHYLTSPRELRGRHWSQAKPSGGVGETATVALIRRKL
ncbi:MAG: AraC family transcriptional regulator, partial [Deinococcota bacterium]|nr:AraC family transcriptional regulator [Deinococcota bacterium]